MFLVVRISHKTVGPVSDKIAANRRNPANIQRISTIRSTYAKFAALRRLIPPRYDSWRFHSKTTSLLGGIWQVQNGKCNNYQYVTQPGTSRDVMVYIHDL